MSVNARTFQILYIIRRRTTGDEGPTTQADILKFIANRRREKVSMLYAKAYISPSSLTGILKRMSTVENLLEFDASDSSYGLSVVGSQMADLLKNIDACTVAFIGHYKREICKAALEQCERLGLGPATPREIAATARISLDSARRGLAELLDLDRVIEDRSSRTATYILKKIPGNPNALAQARARVVVADVLEDAPFPFKTSAQRNPVNAPIAGAAVDPAPTPGDKDENVALLQEIDEEPLTLIPGDPTEKPLPPIPLSLVLGDKGTDNEGTDGLIATDDEVEEAARQFAPNDENQVINQAWADVDLDTRAILFTQATACGMEFTEFLKTIAKANESRMNEALRHTVKFG